MVKIVEMLAPAGSNCRSGHKLRSFLGVTIHETANTGKGAGALNHAKYLQGTGKNDSVSWHYAVDDKLITRSLPENEVAWHAGDGRNGNGNTKTVSIEICVNPESDYKVAKNNAVELAADILARNKIFDAEASLFVHNDWSGKNCPKGILLEKEWPDFNKKVQKELDRLNVKDVKDSALPMTFRVYQPIPGYYTASDAINGINGLTIVPQGSYFVFREVSGAINVTKSEHTPGSWIDAKANARAKLQEIKVGDEVTLEGYVFADSLGNGKSSISYKTKGKITKVTDLSRVYPFHFEGLGWVDPDSIEKV